MRRETNSAAAIAAFTAALVLLVPASSRAQKATAKAPPAAATEEPARTAPAPGEVDEGAADQDADRRTALVSRMVLKVVNPDDAREILKRKAEELGGFPSLITDTAIVIKLPPERLSELTAFAAQNGAVVEKSLERQDLTMEIAQLEGQLKSKHAILARLRGFFDDSNVQATLRIEQTMTSLVTEMENVRGRLRVLEERARHATVDISFVFKQRDRIVYITSPFEWLNTVNLDRFLEEF